MVLINYLKDFYSITNFNPFFIFIINGFSLLFFKISIIQVGGKFLKNSSIKMAVPTAGATTHSSLDKI